MLMLGCKGVSEKKNYPYIISAFLSRKVIRRKIYCQTVSEKTKQKRVYTCLASFTLAKVLTLKGGITCIKSHKRWFPHVSCQVFSKVFWVGCRKCHHLLV